MEPEAVVAAFRQQSEACAADGRSPLYAALMARAADDVEAGGPVAKLLAGWEGHPVLDALAMRFLGGAHAEVLAGRAPELALEYASVRDGGAPDYEATWRALRALVAERPEPLRAALGRQVQTNEVGRSAALLGGFLEVARSTRRPLRILEIGSSAGLNLVWDRHRYRLGPHRWGPDAAALCLDADWQGPAPALDAPARVASREGCDLAPVDLTSDVACQRLESFIWPDQPERIAALRAAVATARVDPPTVVAARARDWLPGALAADPGGAARVLFHSVMWWYLPEDERAAVTAILETAGAAASGANPLAWLRLEGSVPEHCDLRLRLWPGGEDRLLARAHWHGRWIHWTQDRGRSSIVE